MNRFLRKNGLPVTIIISLVFLVVIGISSYIIYVCGFYNKLQENKVLEYYNSYNFDDLYYYMDISNNKYMSKKTYQSIINTMYNKLTLQQIYNDYYVDSNIYKDMDSFVNEFYYGYGDKSKDNFVLKYEGKTTLFTRRKLLIEGIKVRSAADQTSYLGKIKNLTLNIEENASIKLDGVQVDCENNVCNIDYLFGGVHSIEYTSGDFIYFCIYNIDKDNTIINVNNIKNLISINKKVSIDADNFDKVLNDNGNNKTIAAGLYALVECKLGEMCPTLNSYMSINVDGSLTYTRYYGSTVNNYVGTYTFNNGFINIVFDKVDNVSLGEKVTFKINDDGSFGSDYYRFVKKA